MSLQQQVEQFAAQQRRILLERIKKLVEQKGAKFIGLTDSGLLEVEINGKRQKVNSVGNIRPADKSNVDVDSNRVEQRGKNKNEKDRSRSETSSTQDGKGSPDQEESDTYIIILDESDDKRFNLFLFYGMNVDGDNYEIFEALEPATPNVSGECIEDGIGPCAYLPEWDGYPDIYYRDACTYVYNPRRPDPDDFFDYNYCNVVGSVVTPQVFWRYNDEDTGAPIFDPRPIYSEGVLRTSGFPMNYRQSISTTNYGYYWGTTIYGWLFEKKLSTYVGGPGDCYCGFGGRASCYDFQTFTESVERGPQPPFEKDWATSSFPWKYRDSTLVSSNLTHTFFSFALAKTTSLRMADFFSGISSYTSPSYRVVEGPVIGPNYTELWGYSYRINNRTGQTESKVTQLGTSNGSDNPTRDYERATSEWQLRDAYSDKFISALFPDDPLAIEFQPNTSFFEYAAGYSYFGRIRRDQNHGFVYNPKTGRVWKLVYDSRFFSGGIYRGVDRYAVWTSVMDKNLTNGQARARVPSNLPVGTFYDSSNYYWGTDWECLEYFSYPTWNVFPYNTITLGIGVVGDANLP